MPSTNNSASRELARLYADHYAGRHSEPIGDDADQMRLRTAGYVVGPGGRPRITWLGIVQVETHRLAPEEMQKVQLLRTRILLEAAKLAKQSEDGRFSVHELADNLGLSREEWLPHIIESPLFDGNGITLGFFKLTLQGCQMASG